MILYELFSASMIMSRNERVCDGRYVYLNLVCLSKRQSKESVLEPAHCREDAVGTEG